MAGLRVMISALHSSVAFGMPDTFIARSTYSSSCCLSTGFVRKPNAPLCVGLDGVGNRAVRREQQHAKAWTLPLNLLQQLDAVHVVHAQVRHDEVGPEARQRGERLGRALDGLDVVVLRSQADAQEAQEAGVVVDQENAAAQLHLGGRFTVNLDHFRVPEWIVRYW